MSVIKQIIWATAIVAATVPSTTNAQDQAPKTSDRNTAATTADTTQAKAAFQAKFAEYKSAIRDIEKLQAEFQTADSEHRRKLNQEVTGHIAQAQSIMNAMIEAAEAAFKAAPNTDKEVTDILTAVAKHYTIGRQIGAPVPAQGNPQDVYYPIDGGDQFEKALPIIKLLIDGGVQNSELYVWGFLSAFATNDYDLAQKYLDKAKETGAMESLAMMANRDDKSDTQSGLHKNLAHLVAASIDVFDDYKGLWAKESAIRAAEEKANNLPRVKLTTTKGEIVVELFEDQAPGTVANFLTLVKQGFYSGSPFHRVLPGFMAQGGAKTDDGQGGPGYTIRDELKGDYRRHFRGTLSMAKTQAPDSGNSQFFLTFVPTPHLNGRHTAFGRVVEGIEVLGDLQRRSPQHETNGPKPDKIIKAEVLRDRGHEYKFEKLGG